MTAESEDYLNSIIYLSSSVDPDTQEPTIIFSLAALSSIPESISDDTLLQDLIDRCTPWVGEEGGKGYVLIILASEGQTSGRGRGRGFWLWRWRRIPRSFRKNLQRMYIVHPTRFTKTILQVVLPFLSPKSYNKIYPLDSLLSLYRTYGISLSGITLTIPVLQDESRMVRDRPDLFPIPSTSTTTTFTKAETVDPAQGAAANGGWFSGFTLTGMISTAAGYLPYGSVSGSVVSLPKAESGQGYYGRSAEDLITDCQGIPNLMDQLRETILSDCSKTEGIFRMAPGATLRPPLISLLDLPISSQPTLPWTEMSLSDPHLLPKLLLRVFSSAPNPYIPADVYPIIRKILTKEDIPNLLFPVLDPSRILLLSHMIQTFHLLKPFEGATRMTPRNYAICFAPDLIKGENKVEDLEMCLERGKKLPFALTEGRGGGGDGEAGGGNTLVGVLEMWIRDYEAIEGMRRDLPDERFSRRGGQT